MRDLIAVATDRFLILSEMPKNAKKQMVVFWLQQHGFNIADAPNLKFCEIIFPTPLGHHVARALREVTTGRKNYAVKR
jgi:hypothetical protein